MERVIKERMTVQDMESITPQALVNTRPVSAAIKEFFGSSQLSQFMDQMVFQEKELGSKSVTFTIHTMVECVR